MAFPIIPRRRSGTSGNPSSLYLGELAVNTHDGSVYLGADGGVVQIGMPVAAGTTVTEHTGDGTTTAFAFSGYNGTADGGYIVSVGGIDQPPSVYSVNDTDGGTLTFNAAPASGEIVSIRALVAGTGGGGGGTSIGGQIWDVAATYKQGDIVTTSQRDPAWICIENNNTGHDPTASPLWWQPLPADAVSLQLRPVATTAPTTGQVLTWNGTQWAPATISGGGGTGGTVTYTTVGQHYFSVPDGARWARLQATSGTGSAGTNGENGTAANESGNGANGANGTDGTDGAAIWINGSLLLSGGEKGLKGFGGGGGGWADVGNVAWSGLTGNGPNPGTGGTGGTDGNNGSGGNGGGDPATPGQSGNDGGMGGTGAVNGGNGGQGANTGSTYGGGGGGGLNRSGGGGGGGASQGSGFAYGSGGNGGTGTAGASGSSMDAAFDLTSFAGSNLLIEIKPGAGSPSITFTW